MEWKVYIFLVSFQGEKHMFGSAFPISLGDFIRVPLIFDAVLEATFLQTFKSSPKLR